MQTKIFEVRDEGTFIPLFAVDMHSGNPEERYLLRREGYSCAFGIPNIAIAKLSADIRDRFCNDPYAWGDRTFATAHHYIIAHWYELKSGDVIDVSFILGETPKPKDSEQKTVPLD